MPERTTTRGLDPEIQAIAKIDAIMQELYEKATTDRTKITARVLTWLCDRHAPEDWGFYPGGEREPRP